MKVTDNRTITVEIDGVEHSMTLADVQRLYDALATVTGVMRHGGTARPYYEPPWRYPLGGGRITFNTTTEAAVRHLSPAGGGAR